MYKSALFYLLFIDLWTDYLMTQRNIIVNGVSEYVFFSLNVCRRYSFNSKSCRTKYIWMQNSSRTFLLPGMSTIFTLCERHFRPGITQLLHGHPIKTSILPLTPDMPMANSHHDYHSLHQQWHCYSMILAINVFIPMMNKFCLCHNYRGERGMTATLKQNVL